MYLKAYVSWEGSDEPSKAYNFVSALAVHIHTVEVVNKGQDNKIRPEAQLGSYECMF